MRAHTPRARAARRSLAATFVAAAIAAVPADTGAQAPAFVAGRCPAGLEIHAAVDTTALRCGTVAVPQDRASGASRLRKIVLPVAVYATPSAKSREPVIFLAGGPGESAIDVTLRIFLGTPAGQLLARERPIIAFNQRGFGTAITGTLPDLGTLVYRWRATREESIETLADSARQVSRRLRAAGVDPKYFTTLHAVDDVPDVLHALGYERSVLFATSYGTRLALQVIRRHPALVSAAVLDGVAPPQAVDVFDPVQLNERRRGVAARVVDDCLAAPSCRSEFEDLRTLADVLTKPDTAPLNLVFNLPSNGGWTSVSVDRREVLSVIGAFASAEGARPALPQLIEEIARGDTVRRSMAPQLLLTAVQSSALARAAGPYYPVVYHIVACGDSPSGAPQAGGRTVCEALGVPFGGDDAVSPVRSDVPILMLSASYDSQTPPSMAEAAALTLPRSHQVLFPGIGHLAYARPSAGACTAVIVHSFLLDPVTRPTDACARAVMPAFLPRSTESK